MSTIQISLPEDLLSEAKRAAEQQQEPLDDILARALSEHFAAKRRYDTLIERGKKHGSRDRFLAALDTAPKVPPVPGDELDS